MGLPDREMGGISGLPTGLRAPGLPATLPTAFVFALSTAAALEAAAALGATAFRAAALEAAAALGTAALSTFEAAALSTGELSTLPARCKGG